MVLVDQTERGTAPARAVAANHANQASASVPRVCALPPPNHPDWEALIPTAPAVWMARAERQLAHFKDQMPRSGGQSPLPRSPPASRTATPPLAGIATPTPLPSDIVTPSGISSLSPQTSWFSSPEQEADEVPALPWLRELQGVLELPVSDWRQGEVTRLCVAGVETHIPAEHVVDGDGAEIDPTALLRPDFIPGHPLALQDLAEFSALRAEHGISLAYEEHAAIRAVDAAALFKCGSANTRDRGRLHTFFIGQEAQRAVVFAWRTEDALSATMLKDRQTDSITIMLSIRPEFAGAVLDGDLLHPRIHIAESLLGDDGRTLPLYASAVNEIIDTFRHRIAVPYVRDFVRRLQRSGRIDFPYLERPELSVAARARLKRDNMLSRGSPPAANPRPHPPQCYACTATSTCPAQPRRCVCQAHATPRHSIPRLPGALMVQGWNAESRANIVAALHSTQDDDDAMYAALRSLGVCGKHSRKLVDAAVDDIEQKFKLAA